MSSGGVVISFCSAGMGVLAAEGVHLTREPMLLMKSIRALVYVSPCFI